MKDASLHDLLEKLEKDYGLTPLEATKRIYPLWKNGKIEILEKSPASTFFGYLWSFRALWFWILNIIVLTSLVMALISIGPLLYGRYILGSIYVLYLPGSILIEALYPREEDQDPLTRITLSIISSISMVTIVAFILHYTPFRIRLIPIIISLALLTDGLSIFTLIRKYEIYTSSFLD